MAVECDLCHKTYSTERRMTAHQRLQHPDGVERGECSDELLAQVATALQGAKRAVVFSKPKQVSMLGARLHKHLPTTIIGKYGARKYRLGQEYRGLEKMDKAERQTVAIVFEHFSDPLRRFLRGKHGPIVSLSDEREGRVPDHEIATSTGHVIRVWDAVA